MSEKRLAIVTPVYNRADELPALFESLAHQRCQDLKWHVVDDGGSDGSYIERTLRIPLLELLLSGFPWLGQLASSRSSSQRVRQALFTRRSVSTPWRKWLRTMPMFSRIVRHVYNRKTPAAGLYRPSCKRRVHESPGYLLRGVH